MSTITVRLAASEESQKWDEYIENHPDSTHNHLFGWKEVIEHAYHHSAYYFLAEENNRICGVLPVFDIKSYFGSNQLVSMPFLNYGGILSDTQEVTNKLLESLFGFSNTLRSNDIELRQHTQLDFLLQNFNPGYQIKEEKVRMLLSLPSSGDILFKSFKTKLRSQINRPLKENMYFQMGGEEYIKDFYAVFSKNMKDLGSPVHSLTFFREILRIFKARAKVGIVYLKNLPVAAGMIIQFKDLVEIPWASSLKEYNRFSPNMLLYWSFLNFAADDGFKYFDFGRSNKGEGTFHFKKQWGAIPTDLYWYQFFPTKQPTARNIDYLNPKTRKLFAFFWKRLPTAFANLIGPPLRRRISL